MKYIASILIFLLLTINIFPEEIYGKITKIEGERVVIDIGEEAGMREGMLIDVLTEKCIDKNLPCVKVKLIKVYRFASEGVILSENYPSNIKEVISRPVSSEIKEYYYSKDEKINIKKTITRFEQKKRRLNIFGWGLIIGAGALAGTGAWATVQANTKFDEYNQLYSSALSEWTNLNGDMSLSRQNYWRSELRTKRDEVSKWDNTALVLYISSGVVGSWGVYSIYKSKKIQFPEISLRSDDEFKGLVFNWSIK